MGSVSHIIPPKPVKATVLTGVGAFLRCISDNLEGRSRVKGACAWFHTSIRSDLLDQLKRSSIPISLSFTRLKLGILTWKHHARVPNNPGTFMDVIDSYLQHPCRKRKGPNGFEAVTQHKGLLAKRHRLNKFYQDLERGVWFSGKAWGGGINESTRFKWVITVIRHCRRFSQQYFYETFIYSIIKYKIKDECHKTMKE